MSAPVPVRSDFDAALLRKLARRSHDPDQNHHRKSRPAPKDVAASDSDKDRLGVLPIRVGDGDVKGIHNLTTIIPDVRNKPLDETVALVDARLEMNRKAAK